VHGTTITSRIIMITRLSKPRQSSNISYIAAGAKQGDYCRHCLSSWEMPPLGQAILGLLLVSHDNTGGAVVYIIMISFVY